MHRLGALILGASLVCGVAIAAESKGDAAWKPSPTGAALRSLFIPGWGQAYIGEPIRAVIYGGVEQALIYGIFRQHKLYKHFAGQGDESQASFFRNDRNRLTWYLAGSVLLSMMDAYVEAHLYKFDISEELQVTRIDSQPTIGIKFTIRERR